jgi:hypothetical protein
VPSRAYELRGNVLESVGFDDVAFLEVLELGDLDAAFVALGDFANVVLETAQALDLAVEDDRRVADDARLRVARDLARADVAATIVPTRLTLKTCRTSARPSTTSRSIGESIPRIAFFRSSSIS